MRSGAEKIERGEFVIQETHTKRQIDLTQDWELCFLPGQRVDMSMVFRIAVIGRKACPNCGILSPNDNIKEIECSKCGITFGSISARDWQAPSVLKPSSGKSIIRDNDLYHPPLPPSALNSRKRKDVMEDEDEMRRFRRVRIIDTARQSPWRLKVYELRNNDWFDCE